MLGSFIVGVMRLATQYGREEAATATRLHFCCNGVLAVMCTAKQHHAVSTPGTYQLGMGEG